MDPIVTIEQNIYRFGDIVVDGENFRAQKYGQNISLTPRAFDVLIFLLENAGRVVEKQELFDHIWKDTFVSDNALTKVIKEIRRSLEDAAADPHYIETVPKRGYRFIGKLSENAGAPVPKTETGKEDKGAVFPAVTHKPDVKVSRPVIGLFVIGAIGVLFLAGWLTLRQKPAEFSPRPIRSIAVLPFKPLSDDVQNESLEMGRAETLITRLGNVKEIAVRPISAVSRYTDRRQDPAAAGREMQVEAVLDGSIQKAGERVRVTVRLINVGSGATLWSEHFDENFTDIFKVQDSIAERVASALTLQLTRQEREQLTKHFTDDPEAYQLYLQAQLLWNRRGPNWIDQSLAAYQRALEKDPNFALAYIGAADSYIMLSGHRRISMQEAEQKARPEITRALELDPSLAQAHNALAELKYQYEYDWPGAEKEFKTAIDLNPNVAWIRQAYGWFLMSAGRFDEASAEMEKARELDPSSMTINVARGRLFYYSRQYDRAIQHFQSVIAAEPNESSSYYSLYRIYEQKGMYAEALEEFFKAYTMPKEKEAEFRRAFEADGWRGILQKQLEEVQKNTAEAGEESPSSMADIYARMGEKDKAFYWLEKVFDTRDPAVLQFKVEPIYDSLRDDPRYPELVRRIGLQP